MSGLAPNNPVEQSRSSLIVVTGGARSGKSTVALRLAEKLRADEPGTEQAGTTKASAARPEVSRPAPAPVTFIATCPRIPGDDELDSRIDTHRQERPADWSTIEAEVDLVSALARAGDQVLDGASPDGIVIIDCLTLWVSNLQFAGATWAEIEQRSNDTLRVIAQRSGPTVVVTNEVGLGIVPADPETRRYRDVLGMVNQRWIAAADRALFMVAGHAFALSDPMSLLGDVGASRGRGDVIDLRDFKRSAEPRRPNVEP